MTYSPVPSLKVEPKTFTQFVNHLEVDDEYDEAMDAMIQWDRTKDEILDIDEVAAAEAYNDILNSFVGGL